MSCGVFLWEGKVYLSARASNVRHAVVYAATKAAVIMLTKAMAAELAPHNINVNAVAPGYFETDMVKDRIEDKAVLERILAFTPLKRLGDRSDIINPVLFFASDASDFITGQTLFVDGGRTIL